MARGSQIEADRLYRLEVERRVREAAELRQALAGRRGGRAAVARVLLWFVDRLLAGA